MGWRRSCTDCCCLLIYLGVIAGLGVCLWQAVEKGDINRLDSLPDFQGQPLEPLVLLGGF